MPRAAAAKVPTSTAMVRPMGAPSRQISASAGKSKTNGG